MTETQNWTAAEVVDDWCHRHGYDLMDVYEAHSLLAALAEAGFVVVDRERWVRVRDAAEEMEQRIAERGWGEQYTRPGDLAAAGYTIAGPGSVVVPFDGSKRHRVAMAVYLVMLNDDEVAGIADQLDRILQHRRASNDN